MSENLQEMDPVGGFVKGFGATFENATDARVLNFSDLELDESRTQYFQRYLDEYYNAEFIYEQGTEHILEMAKRHAPGGDWLDIGSGTSALFWATGFRDIRSVSCVDLVPEALFVFDRFRASDAVPKCYLEALKIADNTVDTLARIRTAHWNYHQCNVLKPWGSYFAGQTFDMITAYAVFGLAPNVTEYNACFQNLAEIATAEQTILGADWIRSDDFVAFEDHDNRYVSEETCSNAAEKAGFSVVECEFYPIKGDPLYSGVVSWVIKQKPSR